MKLVIKNSQGTFDVTQLITTASVSGDYQQCARTLTFSMLSSPDDKTLPVVSCKNGDGVTLYEGAHLIFAGNIEIRERSTDSSVIDYTAFDYGRILKKNQDTVKASGLTPENLTKSLAGKFGIPLGSIAATGVSLQKNYIGKNLYDIIQSAYTTASEKNGKQYIVRFEGDKLCVREKTETQGLAVLQSGKNLLSTSVTESISKMVNQVVITDKEDKVVKILKNQEDITAYGLCQTILKQSGEEDVTNKAKKALEDGREEQKITVTNFGDAQYITGNSVIVKEPVTGLNGLFWIDGDTHTWKNNIYQNKLVLNFRNIMDEREAGTDPQTSSGKKKTSGSKKDSGQDYDYIYKPETSPTKKG